jgi:pyruvate formate lyase activating enzyme
VDTCGLARTEDLLAVAALTDLFLYDLKLMDDAKHQHYTGVSNALISKNLQTLGRVRERIWLRVPIVPAIDDGQADLESAAGFAATVPGVRQVNLLPFHRTGLPKSQRLGRTANLADVQAPSAETMNRAVKIFRAAGLAVRTGG